MGRDGEEFLRRVPVTHFLPVTAGVSQNFLRGVDRFISASPMAANALVSCISPQVIMVSLLSPFPPFRTIPFLPFVLSHGRFERASFRGSHQTPT